MSPNLIGSLPAARASDDVRNAVAAVAIPALATNTISKVLRIGSPLQGSSELPVMTTWTMIENLSSPVLDYFTVKSEFRLQQGEMFYELQRHRPFEEALYRMYR
jgi:hypothetical protein